MNVKGRSSSITNAFYTAVIPVVIPTEAEEREALEILEISPTDIRCAYCGRESSEWDHFRAIIHQKEPTGYITEIGNLVPSCGKCNQSKGSSYWKDWITGNAKHSPNSRGVPDLRARIERLEKFEKWRKPTRIDFAKVVGPDLWEKHRQNWRDVLALLESSQELAKSIRSIIAKNG